MGKTIQQDVAFPAKAARLFALYADSVLHSAATGMPAQAGKAPGARFSAFGGAITGKVLHIVRNRLWVQTWHSTHWRAEDPESVLILRFEDAPGGGRVMLVHANVPGHDARNVEKGWRRFYWEPWRAFLRESPGAGGSVRKRVRAVKPKAAGRARRGARSRA
jgi:activator of HSP90 ATPase